MLNQAVICSAVAPGMQHYLCATQVCAVHLVPLAERVHTSVPPQIACNTAQHKQNTREFPHTARCTCRCVRSLELQTHSGLVTPEDLLFTAEHAAWERTSWLLLI